MNKNARQGLLLSPVMGGIYIEIVVNAHKLSAV